VALTVAALAVLLRDLVFGPPAPGGEPVAPPPETRP